MPIYKTFLFVVSRFRFTALWPGALYYANSLCLMTITIFDVRPLFQLRNYSVKQRLGVLGKAKLVYNFIYSFKTLSLR
jgi:hypothetical protein